MAERACRIVTMGLASYRIVSQVQTISKFQESQISGLRYQLHAVSSLRSHPNFKSNIITITNYYYYYYYYLLLISLGSLVSSNTVSQVLGLIESLRSCVPPRFQGSQISGLESHPASRSWFLGSESHPKYRVLCPTFCIMPITT